MALPTTPSQARVQHEQDRIKVAVRMRPANTREIIRRGDQVVIECMDEHGDIHVNDRYQSKRYNFDSVFGPGATQKTVFNAVVIPTLDEVLKGYSCTIFAYGQTGTGKTYTMEGDRSDDRALGWEDDPVAGIVPRTVAYFYDRLKNGDYSIRVSYMEIYNENLTDLLSARDGTTEVPLKICVNTAGSACVQNLTEHMVRTKDEIFELLQRGSLKRRTAETKMNERSSRSHAVFMITLVMQQKSDIGEEVVKTGKLYLVDLAGSENISRSGAQEGRAVEAGNINKSLLTLGRVITALVERKPHIPYRDSKLTRLLQDSLGGRNKTTIIATISPALNSLDETLSTLDYAFKAKNILNKPEINQRVSKDVHVKEVYAELEKAKRDLEATWAKMGVTLSKETYQNMQDMLDARREKIQSLEVDVQQFQTLYEESKSHSDGLKKELNGLLDQFRIISKRLNDCRKEILEKETAVAGLNYVDDELRRAESVNVKKLSDVATVADETITQLSCLHDRLQVRSKIEEDNEIGFKQVSKEIADVSEQAKMKIGHTSATQADNVTEIQLKVNSSFSDNCEKLGSVGELFHTIVDQMSIFEKWCDELSTKLQYGDATDKAMARITDRFKSMLDASRSEYVRFVEGVDNLCREGRAEAELKRDEAVAVLTDAEKKTVMLSASFQEKVAATISKSLEKAEVVNLQAQKMDEAAAAMKKAFETLQEAYHEVISHQNEIRKVSEELQAETETLAKANRDQGSKAVSQLVDCFYTKLHEINAEVHDFGDFRHKAIETKGSSEMDEAIDKAKAQAVELDSSLATELTNAKGLSKRVEECSNEGSETVAGTRRELTSLSEFIDSKLTSGMTVIQQSLGKIEEDVAHVSKLPTDFLTRSLKVYQPTGTTPKPQTWAIDREPIIVPPTERLLAGFRPPSELIATAEALEQADAEIMKSAKVPPARSSSVAEPVSVNIDIPQLMKAATIAVTKRAPLGQKASSADDKEN